jgi:hypothetical protein
MAAAHDTSTSTTNNDFYGIPVVDEIWDAPAWQLKSLLIISLAILFQPNAFRKTRIRSITFWIAIIGVAIFSSDTTLIPILSTIIHTRSMYPYIIVIPHSFIAAATYRSKHGNSVHYLQSLILAFFLYGFGGSIVSDLFMGLPVTALSHVRIIPCYLIGWSLVWLSPFDVMFRSYSNPSSSLHYFLQAWEAVDSVTTPMGRISRSARELQNKSTAPIIAGLLAGLGGAGLRHAVGESKSFAALEVGFLKTLSYSLLWWWLAVRNCQNGDYDLFAGNIKSDEERLLLQEINNCDSYNGSDLLRVIFVGTHTIWMILSRTGIVNGHPLVWLCREIIFGRMGKLFVLFFRMGPLSKPFLYRNVNDGSNDEDDDSKNHTNSKETIESKKEA